MHVPSPVTTRSADPREPLVLAHRLPHPIAYVMAGGGAHGSVQWGLLQALGETDIAPDALIGTSAGSLTCSILGEDPLSALSRLAYVWSQLDIEILVGDSWMAMLSAATKKSQSLAENTAEEATLESILVARDFSELKIPTAAVAR
jgi:predicted acylesterase/phospholipase RssA